MSLGNLTFVADTVPAKDLTERARQNFLIRVTEQIEVAEAHVRGETLMKKVIQTVTDPDTGESKRVDRNAEWPLVGQPFWTEAGVDNIIDLRIAKAEQTLDAMIQGGESGTYDFAFIDGDKKNYGVYYDQCLELVRPGGLILIDNVLWGGRLTDDSDQDRATNAIRDLNAKIHGDERVSMSLLPIGDGLTIARKR